MKVAYHIKYTIIFRSGDTSPYLPQWEFNQPIRLQIGALRSKLRFKAALKIEDQMQSCQNIDISGDSSRQVLPFLVVVYYIHSIGNGSLIIPFLYVAHLKKLYIFTLFKADSFVNILDKFFWIFVKIFVIFQNRVCTTLMKLQNFEGR